MAAKQTAIIIGAGVGGLALANILAKAGIKVIVYEKNDSAGGRMGQLKTKGFTFDTGPSWYLMKDVFDHYFSLFGKKTSDYYQLTRLEPGYKVFYESIPPITITNDTTTNLETFESLEPGAAKNLESYLGRAEKNYHTALKYFLYNPFMRISPLFGKEVVSSLPSFLTIFSQSLHPYVQKYFKRQELQQVLEYPSVFLGASPFNTPALYQLMSHLDFKEGVFYPKSKGMYAVTEALLSLGALLGVNYSYNSAVEKIVIEDGIATGVIVDSEFIAADIVVSNADLHFTETTLVDKEYSSYPEDYWKKKKAGPSALLLYLGVKGALPELEHHNLFFVEAWRKNFDEIYMQKKWPKKASMYVSKTTATDKKTAPKGHENLFILVPLPPGVSKSHNEVNDYVDHYLLQLEQMSGVSNLRERIVFKELKTPSDFNETFNSWQNTALGPSHTLRQSAFLRPSVKSKKVKNLYYTGAGTQPGIGVPLCLISAQLMYKHLVKDWSPHAPTEIKEVML